MTAEEFMAARSLIQEIHQSLWWNPWWMTERRTEYDAAWETCGHWTRAEPDLPSKTVDKTVEQYEAELEQKLYWRPVPGLAAMGAEGRECAPRAARKARPAD